MLTVVPMRWTNSSRVSAALGFVEPCLPSPVAEPPLGPEWIYEIKHDGYRLLVRKADDRVRIYTRRGADWSKRFPRIVEAVGTIKCKTALIDGEGVIARPADGLAEFDLLHSRSHDELVTLCAFDLLELNGVDVAAFALAKRKDWLKRLLPKGGPIAFNEHFVGDCDEIFAQACKLGCEGIVAKRIDLPYESGRSRRWVKIKNPKSPAARRAEEGTF